MVSIDVEQICLLELIKAALFNSVPEIPNNANWEKILETAKSQCIVSLIASVVPNEHSSEWTKMSCQSKAKFIKLLYEQTSLINMFKNNDIPLIILKGTATSIYFPVPSARTFGDIDLFVPNDFADSARKLLEENGYVLIHYNERHYGYEKNGVDFELHTKFSCQSYNNIDHIILEGMTNSVEYKIGNSTFPGLPTYENGLVILGHLMQHIKESGIGLRQVIDWMMFVNKELDDRSWEERFKPLAIEAGLEKLAITVTYMCKKWLGLSNEITWCNDADEEVADQLFIRVLDDGNLGYYRSPTEVIKKSIKKEGTFKHLQQFGIMNWPLAQKHPVFRPFAWLFQLGRYAIKGIAGLLSGEKVFLNAKNSMSLEELWERLK